MNKKFENKKEWDLGEIKYSQIQSNKYNFPNLKIMNNPLSKSESVKFHW